MMSGGKFDSRFPPGAPGEPDLNTEGPDPLGNVPVQSVSDLSRALKQTIEGEFGHVRVRGEISRPSFPASGHCYLKLKDDKAVLDGVVWRGTVGRLGVRPEEGLEVVVTGRLTTYAGRSTYQIVIDSMEMAGEGALLKLLEERRRKLAEEGLFDAERKQALPFLPEVIGVVTSPTGAVIRDILHRLADRFPRPVLVWPVVVQGEAAAGQVAAAIAGFNALAEDGDPPRPDLIIVARGGGSLEDLWAFNEEEVVRAAAASAIPLISAVGHETDTTLIDFAADVRAPTPTAAAEMAVPVRADLAARVGEDEARLRRGLTRLMAERRNYLTGLARGLPEPERLLQAAWQRLDDRWEATRKDAAAALRAARHRLEIASGRLTSPRERVAAQRATLGLASQRLAAAYERALGRADRRLGNVASRLSPDRLAVQARQYRRQLPDLEARMAAAVARGLESRRRDLSAQGRTLESLSYRAVLARGFAVVRDAARKPVTRAGVLRAGDEVRIEFADGPDAEVPAVVSGAPAGKAPAKIQTAKKQTASKSPADKPARQQGELF